MGTRVLVIDDSALYRRIVSDALATIPGVEVAGTANHGKMALARIASLRPDLVTLDIEMPGMNGLEVLQALNREDYRPGIVVLSALTVRGGEMTIRALEAGAFDFVTKPRDGGPEANIAFLGSCLTPIVRAFELGSQVRRTLRGLQPQAAPPPAPARPAATLLREDRASRKLRGSPIVLIGVSTGGPAALARVLPDLPAGLGAPVFIVQHMPSLFTQPLAASLAARSAIRVKEAEDGESALANCAYIAPGGRHMKLAAGPQGEILVRVTDDAPENNCRPSVDYLFRSAALHFPGRAVAVILTGMGSDGTAGLRMLKRGGCASIAQDEASCVVFGMPKEAIAAGVVDTVAPLDSIAGAVLRNVREMGR